MVFKKFTCMKKCYINGIINILKVFLIFDILKSLVQEPQPKTSAIGTQTFDSQQINLYIYFCHFSNIRASSTSSSHRAGLPKLKDLKNSEGTNLYCFTTLNNKFNLIKELTFLIPSSLHNIKEKPHMR